MSPPRRVLLIEDDPDLGALVPRLLRRASVETVIATTLDEARALLAATSFDALLVDHHLPDGDGIELLAALRARGVTTPAVLMSGTPVAAPDARTRFLKKPFARDALPMLVATMVPAR